MTSEPLSPSSITPSSGDPEPGLTQPRDAEAASSQRVIMPAPTIHWYESWIIRAALIASFILFLGYSVSAFFAFASIDTIARWAHDQEIEESLGGHLESIKKVHVLEQELVVERLKPFLAAWQRSAKGELDEATVRHWLDDADLERITNPKNIKIQAFAGKAEPADGALKWLDRDKLKVLDFTLEFPKGAVYESFKAAEDIRQRYQLVGANIDGNIRPSLIRALTTVSIVSFLLLVSLFIIYAQRFKTRITEVMSGFALWSERDSMFRFDEHYTGELRLLTLQFNSMADEVEANRQRSLYLEKIASWQIIARKLAHEIKNPLTPIQMMVSQLKRRYKGEDKDFGKLLEDAQNIITEEVSGLRRMVDNFSNFARLPEPAPRDTDLVSLCRHAAELQKPVYAQHQIAFDTRYAKALAFVDEDLIRQVLINLIKNAAEACGETPSKITVGLEEAGGDLVVSVRDDGPGIPADLIGRIFEAYFTTKHTGPTPGMGLGLAVCQKIVMDHGGKLSVKSRPGETLFSIRLPRRKKDSV